MWHVIIHSIQIRRAQQQISLLLVADYLSNYPTRTMSLQQHSDVTLRCQLGTHSYSFFETTDPVSFGPPSSAHHLEHESVHLDAAVERHAEEALGRLCAERAQRGQAQQHARVALRLHRVRARRVHVQTVEDLALQLHDGHLVAHADCVCNGRPLGTHSTLQADVTLR